MNAHPVMSALTASEVAVLNAIVDKAMVYLGDYMETFVDGGEAAGMEMSRLGGAMMQHMLRMFLPVYAVSQGMSQEDAETMLAESGTLMQPVCVLYAQVVADFHKKLTSERN